MISAFPKATPTELQDIRVFWRMSVDCQDCHDRTRRHRHRRRLRTVYPLQCSLAHVIACRGRWLVYRVVSHEKGAASAPGPVVVFAIAV